MIRTANFSDTPALLELFILLKAQDVGVTGFQSWNESKFEAELKVALVKVFEGPEIRGFVLYRAIPDGFEITLLGTHPQYQKTGIMRLILKDLLSSLSPSQIIWLEVHEKNNAARRLYEQLGFKTTGRRPRYYYDGSDALNLEYKS